MGSIVMGSKQVGTSRFPFTMERLKKLAAPERGRVYHYDSKTPGLCLVVTEAGSKSYYLYRKIDGRPERIRLGKFPNVSIDDARSAVREMVGEIAAGKDPASERRARRESPTLKELFSHWLTVHAKPRKKTWKEDQRVFKKYFTVLAGRRLKDIIRADVQRWHARLGEKHGHYQANRARALLSAMWRAADDLGVSLPNPCVGVKRFAEESRERFLLPDEMGRFFAALAVEEPLWRDYFLVALFTGARRGNVQAMRWEQLDLGKGLWYLPGSAMKNGKPMVIVLAEPARVILESRQASRKKSDFVFPANRRAKQGHVVDPYKPWARILERAGISGMRPHDLRRSLGSWQAAAGSSLPIIGKSLGHRDQSATAIYSRLQLDPVRASVEAAVSAMREAGGVKGNGVIVDDAVEGNGVIVDVEAATLAMRTAAGLVEGNGTEGGQPDG
ncbi:MAG: tyrosine-type recombinase/integrase [Planctomycetia bacterium]|nr:tyrosine-type recombinase/integrase [Planctomycetia bacterium]